MHLVLSSLSHQFCELVGREDVSPQWSIFIMHKINGWCELHFYKQNYNPSLSLRAEADAVQLFMAEGRAVSHFHSFRSFSAGWVIWWGILPTKELQSIFFVLTFSGLAQQCSFSPLRRNTGGAGKKLQWFTEVKTEQMSCWCNGGEQESKWNTVTIKLSSDYYNYLL